MLKGIWHIVNKKSARHDFSGSLTAWKFTHSCQKGTFRRGEVIMSPEVSDLVEQLKLMPTLVITSY